VFLLVLLRFEPATFKHKSAISIVKPTSCTISQIYFILE